MGLLDTGGFDDPGTLGLLSFGARMSNAPGGFMRALGPSVLGALNDRGQAKQDIAKQAQEQLRMQLLQQQMMDAQAKRAEEAKARANLEAFRAKIQSPMMDASQAALSGGGGPTNANAAQMRPVDPRQQMMFEAMQLGQVSPMDYLQSMAPKPEETKVVGDALVGIGPQGVRELYKGAPKQGELPSAVREYEYAKGQGYNGSFQDFQLEQKRAGASSVSVNTGQKGFDNTLKLRGDFRSEPIYKAHQEVQSAHSQITQSLKMASPAGDLAGATKLMKILDPGSVVRESELGMAMAATGLMDRLENYASSVVKGTKLTPSQRLDFQKLADALFSESQSQYNSKRQEYEGISSRNGLNSLDVLGPVSDLKPKSSLQDLVNKHRSK